ncbi:hypothetical protein KFK09_029061 [Dendrobium nobile]|uniref:Integrase catalytic domain-containing protein n=1 Tax=Dendrobium nobile TaxID=94219 RepID=A0A8T3A569_DENNO|nr:hypothetical protein KFK09_029061 [Dendrobium nobile]
MADQESLASLISSSTTTTKLPDLIIPTSLKFLISNIKTLVLLPLSSENYHIWRLQLLQTFMANGFAGFLTGESPCPTDHIIADYNKWRLIDRNLISALFSTISAAVLPYVLSSSTAQEVWQILEKRMQPTNRSRVIQLKNELHHIQMRNSSMQQYLMQIKNLVDNIAVSGSQLDTDDIILYILNGLPSTYNSFKTAIHTSLQPIDLDTLYSLLCSEEINIQQETQKDSSATSDTTTLYVQNTGNYRGKNQYRSAKHRSSAPRQDNSGPTEQTAAPKQSDRPTCQICRKRGHSALNCWHRCNLKYAPMQSPAPQRALMTQQSSTPISEWVLDSGASAHLTPDITNQQQRSNYNGQDSVSIANGSSLSIQNSGQGLLPLPDSARKLHLQNLLHVPTLTHNLISISKLTNDNQVSICFDANGFVIKDLQDNRPFLRGQMHNGLYTIRHSPIERPEVHLANNTSANLWHSRLGHPHQGVLPNLRQLLSNGADISGQLSCTSCNLAKSHKLKFNTNSTSSTSIFSLIHSDVWGPAPAQSFNGFNYFVIFIDDFSKFTWLYLMRSKNETFLKFSQFCALIKNQFNATPKIFRSDGGGEFNSTQFTTFLSTHGIAHQLSCPHTPEQNGTAERKNMHLLETTRALLHTSHLPSKFWAEAEAVSTANYLINRLPSKAIAQRIPYQLLHNKNPSYDHLRTFGCLCFPWLRPYSQDKLSPRLQSCIFLGYSSQHKGYRCLDLLTNKIRISRHVKFNEQLFPYADLSSFKSNPQSSTNTTTSINPLLLIPTSLTRQPACSISSSSIPSPIINKSLARTDTTTSESTAAIQSPTRIIPPPTAPKHPMQTRAKSAQSPQWISAMTEEIQALNQKGTWTLVPPPSNDPILGCKWTF